MSFPWEAKIEMVDPEGGVHRVSAAGQTEEEAVGRLRRSLVFFGFFDEENVTDVELTVTYTP